MCLAINTCWVSAPPAHLSLAGLKYEYAAGEKKQTFIGFLSGFRRMGPGARQEMETRGIYHLSFDGGRGNQ